MPSSILGPSLSSREVGGSRTKFALTAGCDRVRSRSERAVARRTNEVITLTPRPADSYKQPCTGSPAPSPWRTVKMPSLTCYQQCSISATGSRGVLRFVRWQPPAERVPSASSQRARVWFGEVYLGLVWVGGLLEVDVSTSCVCLFALPLVFERVGDRVIVANTSVTDTWHKRDKEKDTVKLSTTATTAAAATTTESCLICSRGNNSN